MLFQEKLYSHTHTIFISTYDDIIQVDFDTELDLSPFMSNRRGPPQPYSLYGVLVHSGHSVHSGHYFAFVKAPNGLWHQLDDNHVSQVSKGVFDLLVTTNWCCNVASMSCKWSCSDPTYAH